ncbi:MAG: AAA family ATPase [Candidatus Altiarchaeales archaeon ex4484_43]|nr:MAG: AAA family ATPase [Candidatus Altiarchaeales archaeon ex4484_43]
MVEKKGLELKVAEALQNDVGRGIVRIDEYSMRNLDVTSGDIVEIEGKKKTAAIVWPSHIQDSRLGIIRMDGILRQNSKSSLGDRVIVRKAEFSGARRVIIAPTRHEIRFGGDFGAHLRQRLLGRPLVVGDTLTIGVLGQAIPFIVAKTEPKGIVQVQDFTEFEIKEKPMKVAEAPAVRYEDIGGLKEEISRVREMVELPMKHPELFEKLYGESERKLREIFKEGEENAPSIIFIDEIDSIAPKREDVRGEVERRVVAQLLALMDGLVGRGNVIVIGATNREDSIDPALRRPGRFDREIEIGVPDRDGRKEILQIHTRGMPLAEDVDLDEIANSTHGFVGADLEALTREAAMNALKRVLPKIDLEREEIPVEILENLRVEKSDFVGAMKSVSPSALREIFVEIPDVKWEDIGGLEKVKQELKEAVEWPMKYPDAFKRMGIRPSKAVLLYGPPGCGKTLLAKASANESEANLIAVKGPELLSMWVGESERAVREVFKKAKQTAPTIILFDEIDALAPRRSGDVTAGSHVTETVVNQLLTEMDGIETLENVIVIGATNRPDILDPSLLRPGRFDSRVLVPAPDRDARLEIFKIHTRNMPLHGVDLEELANKTKGYSGADIEAVCREAAMIALRKNIDSDMVTGKNFERALKKVKPSISKIDMKRYEEDIIDRERMLTPAYG